MNTDTVFDIQDRVIVLTGGCGLIGKKLSEAFAERGAKVVIVDVAAKDPESAAKRLGDDHMGRAVDVSDEDAVKALRDEVIERYGRVDVLINNHHYLHKGAWDTTAETFPSDAWRGIIDVNLTGLFWMCREFGSVMLDQGKGNIINLASTYGVVSSNPALYTDNSLASPIAYSASKGGVIMVTRYLASYWSSRGVRVNSLSPHGVWNHHEPEFEKRFSDMTPINRMMQPDELVGAALFLASDASSYVNGTNLMVDGGWTAW